MILRVKRMVRGAPGDAFFRRLGVTALRKSGNAVLENRAEVSLVLCGDAAVRRLNRVWRGKDRPTDVLSFPLLDHVGRVPPKGCPLALGDVVISVPMARRQAKEAGKSTAAETGLLWVHGLLHLMGYDHAVKRDEKIMFTLQESILGAAGMG